jgi:NAD(P)-dependent dehydrogenase (short-subunit alcohol dehydrogenase family)
MGRLDGKVAIVTGAATGLGREIAILYAEEGARVVVGDIREAEAEETVRRVGEAGGEGVFVATDVSKSADLQRLVRTAEQEFGALHIATANAGIGGRAGGTPLADLDEELFDEVMSVNFGGTWLCFKYAIPAIKRAGGGAMTATTSVAAHRGLPGGTAYAASKSAISGLVRSLSSELEPEIRVNEVAAGWMATELRAHAAEARGIDLPRVEKEIAESQHSDTWGRISSPREVAQAHLFLVSDDASYINGQTVFVDGGASIRMLAP